MIGGAMIGRRFDRCTFDTYKPGQNSKAIDACIRLADGKVEGVLLFGPVGVGKTHLLVALARAAEREARGEFVDEGYRTTQQAVTVEYWPVFDLAGKLREEIYGGLHEILRRCQECGLLILDDLGAERSTDYVLEALERIIDYRYRDQRPIAIGTNLTPDQIQRKYGDRAISRWAQSCEVVEMVGADHRVNNGGERETLHA